MWWQTPFNSVGFQQRNQSGVLYTHCIYIMAIEVFHLGAYSPVDEAGVDKRRIVNADRCSMRLTICSMI